MAVKLNNITKYFGFAVVVIEWLGFLLCILLRSPDWSEPASQFGYYGSTRIVFGLTFTLGALAFYLFARNLNAYWRHSSKFALLAGIGFAVTGWVPYQPYANTLLIDVHNLALVVAIVLYASPMWFIGYKKVHSEIARASRIGVYAMVLAVSWSLIARVLDLGVIVAQLLSILPFHAWLVAVNILLLKHHKEISEGYTGKL